jgi:hypothetical protein
MLLGVNGHQGEGNRMSEQDQEEVQRILAATFLGEALRRRAEIAERDMRFVHYTSADVAMSIIQNKSVWMRNAITMNDFSEIHHGKDCVFKAWNSAGGERLKVALEEIHPGVVADLQTLFTSWQHDLENNTYLTSLSEHESSEDNLGRLSMWRAYGGRSGVALVLNRTPFEVETDDLHAYSTPVSYGDQHTVEAQFEEVATKVIENRELIEVLTASHIVEMMFLVLRFAVLGTKHPAFSEEREWRVVYSPNLARSEVIRPFVHSVRGVPQVIQRLPLENDAANGLHGAAIPDLLHRLIIGPTEDPRAMFDAFVVLLADAGVPNPSERIWISGIPLRQW